MKVFTIRKKFRFEMAHILDSSYSKLCQQIHGHGFILEVFIRDNELNEDGMVIDFGLVKEKVGKLIDYLDHATLVHHHHPDYDRLSVLEGVKGVPFNPTAEKMVQWLYMEIKEDIPLLYKIRLHETESGYAEYQEEL